MTQLVTISVIATVRNEATGVDAWLDALLTQTLRPDEVVIVDGGSIDGTFEAIARCADCPAIPIVLLSAPHANIAQGRNLAIDRARGNLIAVTDAGTIADAYWLERLIAPLLDGDVDVASGFFVPRLDGVWDRALAATTLPDAAEIEPSRFLPSSRSMAFRRGWFDAGIRYPEWLDYCEDLVWDLAMQRAGARFQFVPDGLVTFAVRPTPRSFTAQYIRYARGDGKAGLFPRRHALRYATYVTLAISLKRRRVSELAVAGVLGAAYLWRPVTRLRTRDRSQGRPAFETVTAIPLMAALRGLGDLAKMIGYPLGLVWRWQRYGSLGWRTAWTRVSPKGELFRPSAMTRGSQLLEASLSGESHEESR